MRLLLYVCVNISSSALSFSSHVVFSGRHWRRMMHVWCNNRISACLKDIFTLHWRHNGHESVSNHQPHDCLLNRLFGRRLKNTSKLRVTGLCVGKSPGTGESPAQMASNAENVSIWCRHHDIGRSHVCKKQSCVFPFRWWCKARNLVSLKDIICVPVGILFHMWDMFKIKWGTD